MRSTTLNTELSTCVPDRYQGAQRAHRKPAQTVPVLHPSDASNPWDSVYRGITNEFAFWNKELEDPAVLILYQRGCWGLRLHWKHQFHGLENNRSHRQPVMGPCQRSDTTNNANCRTRESGRTCPLPRGPTALTIRATNVSLAEGSHSVLVSGTVPVSRRTGQKDKARGRAVCGPQTNVRASSLELDMLIFERAESEKIADTEE